jgi:predicted transcriptional regulator
MLLKFGFIKKEEIENHEIYFDARTKESKLAKNYISSKEKSKKIIDFLKENDQGLTKTHLAKVLEMHHNTITKYLNLLEDMDIIIKKKIYKQTLYFLNDKLVMLNLNP